MRWIVDTLQRGRACRSSASSPAADCPPSRRCSCKFTPTCSANKISLAESDESVALGAPILGCLAAGPEVTGYHHASQAIHAMASQNDALVYLPAIEARNEYEQLYKLYRSLTGSADLLGVMRLLRAQN